MHLMGEHSNNIIDTQLAIDGYHSQSLFSEVYDKYFTGGVDYADIDAWDGIYFTKITQSPKISLSVVSRKIGSICMEVYSVDIDKFINHNMNSSEFAAWDRSIATLIYNCESTLRLVAEDCTNMLLTIVFNYADTQKSTYLIISLCSAGGIIFTMLLLFPFIIRAHTNVAKVYKMFVAIQKKEYGELINSAQNYLEETNKHFSAIKKLFDEIDFKDAQREEEEAMQQVKQKYKEEKRWTEDKHQKEENKDKEETEKLNKGEDSQDRLSSQLESMDAVRKKEV